MQNPKVTAHFHKYYKFVLIPKVYITRLMWKDKWDSPSVERCPSIEIVWLKTSLYIQNGDILYWGQRLWVDKYNDGDYYKARSTWGWKNMRTKKTTWKEY
jgi:hypothetical protein